MKHFRIYIFAMLILTFNACTSDDLITMEYQMTQCADPWMTDTYFSSDKEATLTQFLEEKGVEVISLKITVDCSDMAVCAACICEGCDHATVKVKAEHEQILKDLGFTKI